MTADVLTSPAQAARAVPGIPQTGLWCGVCQLPTRIRIPLITLTGDGAGEAGAMEDCIGCAEDRRAASLRG